MGLPIYPIFFFFNDPLPSATNQSEKALIPIDRRALEEIRIKEI